MKKRLPLRCPTCNKPITPEPVRVCARCHRPILRGHKWTLEGGALRHRHCQAPDSYLTAEEYIAQFGREMYNRMHGVSL